MVVISDEVYENLTYDGVPHVRIATLPGMWERTLTLCSAGKTFSVTGACLDQGVNDTAPMDADLLTMTRHYTTTGWKIGWLVGHAKLISGVMCCNQWCVRLSIAAVPVETNPTQVNRPSTNPYTNQFAGCSSPSRRPCRRPWPTCWTRPSSPTRVFPPTTHGSSRSTSGSGAWVGV